MTNSIPPYIIYKDPWRKESARALAFFYGESVWARRRERPSKGFYRAALRPFLQRRAKTTKGNSQNS
jgi:hypothetical protein